MKYTFQFNDDNEKQNIMTSNKDKILIEIQYLFTGNFLVFSDIKPMDIQLSNLTENQLTIMSAIADLYMQINPAT